MANTILYLGRFEMPDKDATANRVLSNGKLLRDIGYDVEFFGWSSEKERFKNGRIYETEYCGFKCYEKPAYAGTKDRLRSIYDASDELAVISKRNDLKAVICYNFPSVAMRKIFSHCKKRKILCLADVTEWYGRGNKSILTQLVRVLDSEYRMKVVHKKADGLIVISRYLENYYKKQNTLILPPLVDIKDPKWKRYAVERSNGDEIKLIYAGSPSGTKEKLNGVVEAIDALSKETAVSLKIFGITEEKFRKMYAYEKEISKSITFYGKVSHLTVLEEVKKADYSLIIRESNRVTNAGFPSKFSECIACGTAVICTDISDLKEIVEAKKCGYIISTDRLVEDFRKIFTSPKPKEIDTTVLDYRSYIEETNKFIKGMEK